MALIKKSRTEEKEIPRPQRLVVMSRETSGRRSRRRYLTLTGDFFGFWKKHESNVNSVMEKYAFKVETNGTYPASGRAAYTSFKSDYRMTLYLARAVIRALRRGYGQVEESCVPGLVDLIKEKGQALYASDVRHSVERYVNSCLRAGSYDQDTVMIQNAPSFEDYLSRLQKAAKKGR